MRYARIEENKVAEIFESEDIDAQFNPLFVQKCVQCDESVNVGMLYDTNGFTPDSPDHSFNGVDWVIEFEFVKNRKQIEILSGAETLMGSLASEYGAMERTTWDQQYNEAMDYQNDSGSNVPLLDSIATFRGMEVATLAERIVSNRAEWVELSGSIVGQRLAYQDQLDSATTLYGTDPEQALSDLQSIEVSYTIPTVNLVDK